MEHTAWAAALEGVTPIARLLAFWLGDQTQVGPDPIATKHYHESDLTEAMEWIGCEVAEIEAAFEELTQHGMSKLAIVGDQIRYRFPDSLERRRARSPKVVNEAPLAIYVISGGDKVSKIGISEKPAMRLRSLQASNPGTRLHLVWQAKGPTAKIRRAEQRAHSLLSNRLIHNEWFGVSADEAIDVVKRALKEVGL